MCPACLATLAVTAAGASAVCGLAFLAGLRPRQNRDGLNETETSPTQEFDHG